MKKLMIFAAMTAMAAPAAAQDFSEGSEARSWNLYAEQPARFEAKVVDILCELSGDCPDNCGDGKRQLGLLRAADGVLVYPNKNSQPAFTGAALPLLMTRVNIDPALAGGVVLTTVTDVVGFFSFLGLATLFYA